MANLEGVRKAVVLGLGKVTGAAAARALLAEGVEVRVTEAEGSEDALAQAEVLRSEGATVEFGEPAAALPFWADLVVPSPGVPPGHPLIKAALEREVRVWSEIELGYRFLSGPLVAITGTNGKTTTTTLCRTMLEASGIEAVAAGNIGRPFVEAARESGDKTIVCEVSSAQLFFVGRFRPQVAVILNIADDHYDWHEGFDDYAKAKARITEKQTSEDLLIVRAGDPACLAIASGSQARISAFGASTPQEVRNDVQAALNREIESAGGCNEIALSLLFGELEEQLIRTSEIRVRGTHNTENVLAAALAASAIGGVVAEIGRAVKNFIGLPHRMQLVQKKEGITWINDSKATNPDATLRALEGMERVVLIVGGRSKGLDLSLLARTKEQIKGLVVMGEAADELQRIFAGVPIVEARDVESAAAKAREMAVAGDTIMLSPACSSLDQYDDYADRGDRFIKAAKARA
ncbi:MAG TPA: UDP-N-acetylmuramoyl-L-alanine--D-glutamate ligase [Actinomycetota bacterium]|nr:UDP-N-acetylmuramoyl-L-alanine--D-glutamate ligase [Actinomycetota bacterium]